MQIITKENESKKYIEIGVITNTHKLNGQIKIKSFSDDLTKYDKLYIKEKGIYIKLDLKLISNTSDIYIAEIKDINSSEEAFKYKNKKLYIKESDLKPLTDEYYIKDVIGSKCYDEKNSYLGKIVDVLTYTKIEVFVISSGEKEICIPNQAEYIIKMDIEEKICEFNVEKLRAIF